MTRNLSIIAFATVLCCAVRADNLFLSVMGDTGGGADLTTGLAAWWDFDDLNDSSGQGNHLEKSPLCTATNGVATFPGIATNWIRTANTNFCAGATNLVVSFWHKNTSGVYVQWFWKWQRSTTSGDYAGPELMGRPDIANVIRLLIYGEGSGSYIYNNATNVPQSTYTNWHHYCVQWGKTNSFSYWIDGVPLGLGGIAQAGTRPDVIFPARMYLGNSEAGAASRVLGGVQTRYRIYTNRPISTDVVLQLYQEGHGQ